MTESLPLNPPIEETRPERDRRLDVVCPGCGVLVGELVIYEGVIYLGVGGLDEDGLPYGLLIDVMDRAQCVRCGRRFEYYFSRNLQKILRKRGYTPQEIRDIITGAQPGE